MGDAAELVAIAVAGKLRKAGTSAQVLAKGQFKKRMAKASSLGATYALILGDDEVTSQRITVRNLDESIQATASISSIGRIPLSLLYSLNTGDPEAADATYIGGLLRDLTGQE